MASITAFQGNYISDIILNSSGNISNWDAILTENECTEWVPDVYSGEIFQLPTDLNINASNLAELHIYPANNFSVPDIYNQIDSVFALLNTATPTIAPVIQPTTQDLNNYYTVLQGEGIVDIILNSTGNIANWFQVINDNEDDTWTPVFFNGQLITISPDNIQNLNNYRALNLYPANNFSVPDIDAQIQAVFDELNHPVVDWILGIVPGFWSDNGVWRDNAFWID